MNASLITETLRQHLAAVRAILEDVVKDIGATDEASFNAAAATVNKKIAAIRTWIEDGEYIRGDMTIDPEDGVPYWAIHSHGKSTGHVCQPSKSPTMWAHCHGTSPETARPFIAESYNTYSTGHYCIEGNVVARCIQDGIVYPPSVLPAAWEIIS